ncbi:discoidin domain-containing protein (plasmid) [Streptomyces sp. AHU1]|uniref:discoidin domain-containing protein n=1 Tax=Streptomyces sp. AHU1 TaxID=3377215 RepID=UPI003877E5CE
MPHPSVRKGAFAPLRRSFITVVCLAAAVFSTAGVVHAAPEQPTALTIYVSPRGLDTAAGTVEHPFKTLEHARDYVREMHTDTSGDIRVRLMSGTYRLSRTFTLNAEDSGHDDSKIVYEAAPGTHPVISGGKQVTGWEAADSEGHVYKARVGDVDTRQLYVDGALQTRARSSKNPTGFSKTSTGYTFTDSSLAAYKHPSDLEVVSSWGWKLMRCPVQAINDDTMTMQQPCWHNANLQQGQEIQTPTWLENARELLDTPGEWYLDKSEGEIYYWPKADQDLSTATVTIPLVQNLVDLNGTRSVPVSGVTFRGITFAYSTWLAPSSADGLVEGQAGFRMIGDNPDFDSTRLKWQKTPGAVNVSYGDHIAFENNTFTHLGAVGLNLNTGSQNTRITGNLFHEIAATGIQIGGVTASDAHPDDPRDLTRNTTVDNNAVTQAADQYNGSVGILAGYTDHTVISHNKVHDLPYSGISVGWGWGLTDQGGNTSYPGNAGVPVWNTPTISRDNKVTHNEIYDIMQSQSDGGAIYTLSANPGGLVADNYIHDIPAPAYGAVYHDEGSRYWTNTNNAFCGVAYQWLLMNHALDTHATGNFTTQPAYTAQGNSTNSTATSNTTVGACDQLPASIVADAGLQPGYRHLDPGPSVSDHRAPGRPGTPTATTDFPTVADLNWPAATDDTGVTGYAVYSDSELISATGKTSVRIASLTAGKTYTFRITARDAAANESQLSYPVTITMPTRADLALNKPTVASSTYSSDHTAAKAVDGDLSTRWAQGSGLPDPSWIQVDLGSLYDIDGAITAFEKSNGYKYRIDVSADEVHWKTLADRTNTDTTAMFDYVHAVAPVTGRWVRLTVTGSSGNGGSIYDLQVYGTAHEVTDHAAPMSPGKPVITPLMPTAVDLTWPAATDDTAVTSYVVYQDGKRIGVTDNTTLRVVDLSAQTQYAFTVVARDGSLNASEPSEAAVVTTPSADQDLALHKQVTASSQYSDDYAPDKAVDGDPSTRWAQGSGLPDPSWIQVDLSKEASITGVVTTFEKSGGYKYRLEYSADGQSWSVLDDHTDLTTMTQTSSSVAEHAVTARYLRLTITDSNWNGGSIYALRAYGTL